MQQRYYDPIAGRFLSVDPVTTDAKTGNRFNRYVYGNNNPYRFKDPDGRIAQELFVLGAGAALLSTACDSCRQAIGNGLAAAAQAVNAIATTVSNVAGNLAAAVSSMISTPAQTPGAQANGNGAPSGKGPDGPAASSTSEARSPVLTCTNCGAPHGGVAGVYCPSCDAKSQDPKGGVPPNPSKTDKPPEKPPEIQKEKNL